MLTRLFLLVISHKRKELGCIPGITGVVLPGGLKIYAGINNLTNTHYASMLVVNARGFGGTEPRYYYPGLPRHGYGGITCTF